RWSRLRCQAGAVRTGTPEADVMSTELSGRRGERLNDRRRRGRRATRLADLNGGDREHDIVATNPEVAVLVFRPKHADGGPTRVRSVPALSPPRGTCRGCRPD